MSPLLKHHIFTASACLCAALLVSCGDTDSGKDGAPTRAATAEPPTAEQAVTTDDGVTVVRITGNDQMQYNIDRFEVSAGTTVKLIFENIGKMPRAAMGHNVVILNSGRDAMAYAQEASKAGNEDYMPAALSAWVLASTRLLGPGETDQIEFTAPDPGEYPFVCSFPAHTVMGMKGVMAVTPAAGE